jgi:para-nitrobenzyl esterase
VEVEWITDRIQESWVRFAATGDPNGDGLPPWPVATVDSPIAIVLDSTPRAEPLPATNLLQALVNRLQGRAVKQR